VDERTLAGARHTGHDDEHAQWDIHVDVLQVVLGGLANLQRTGSTSHRPLQGGSVVEVPTRERVTPPQFRDRALEDDLAAAGPRMGPEVDDVVGDRDRLGLVLHDQHGVALVAELLQQAVHPLDVMGMQADRGFVEDVRDIRQRRPQMTDHLGALGLTTRQRARGPVE
jgi:hypothetical protein